ncbi:hypothetical protein HETIRDRAFT_101840, partial [Heterobasidion irregulare TC 32-1]
MTTWAQPAHHPWFKMNSLKRKQSPDDVDDALPIASTPTRRDHKRRRCTGLERGLAGLTLS